MERSTQNLFWEAEKVLTTVKGKMVRLLNIYGNVTGTRFKVELSIESNVLQLFDIYFYQEKGRNFVKKKECGKEK